MIFGLPTNNNGRSTPPPWSRKQMDSLTPTLINCCSWSMTSLVRLQEGLRKLSEMYIRQKPKYAKVSDSKVWRWLIGSYVDRDEPSKPRSKQVYLLSKWMFFVLWNVVLILQTTFKSKVQWTRQRLKSLRPPKCNFAMLKRCFRIITKEASRILSIFVFFGFLNSIDVWEYWKIRWVYIHPVVISGF